WPAISAELTKSAPVVATPVKRSSRVQWIAIAATVFALAVGIWIGRNTLPTSASQPAPTAANSTTPSVVNASFVTDPRYLKDRARLVSGLEAQLKTLPPKTQEQVAASLATIRKSMSDIQAALGRDPANALLQELLVNTYQDEMRVLTAVHQAGEGQEI